MTEVARQNGAALQVAIQNVVTFGRLLRSHLRVYWLVYPLVAAVAILFHDNYRVGINQTASLPQSVFLIHKNELPSKGDYVAFRVAAGGKFDHSAILTKIVVGVEGDVVDVADRVVTVNGHAVGYAKTKSLKGEPLEPIQPTKIGRDQVYVMGLHKDSLDSRYTIVGLVSRADIVGRAYPIW